MAILNVGHLSLEIRHEAFRYDWVYYNIWCRWLGKPIVSESLMRRDAPKYQGVPEGAFVVCEYRECTLLPMLCTVLETNRSAEWGNQDFDLDIVAYAGTALPYYNGSRFGMHRTPNTEEHPPTDEDPITLLVLFNSHFLAGPEDGAGSDGGPAFCYAPRRAALTRFYTELRAEYVAFSAHEGIEEAKQAHYGSKYEEPWF